jgi:hypothetical protein
LYVQYTLGRDHGIAGSDAIEAVYLEFFVVKVRLHDILQLQEYKHLEGCTEHQPIELKGVTRVKISNGSKAECKTILCGS